MSWSGMIDTELDSDMVEWRRHLHAHPELGFREFETTRFIEDKLRSWGIDTERALETGVIGHIRGAPGGPVLCIRADIDALPVHERTESSFSSKNAGVMHACGHDGHTAILLGVAKALARFRPQLPGEVRLLFQPAEEVVPGGAKALVDSGKLDDLGAMIGLHIWSGIDIGLISARQGPLMASTDEFEIRIDGVGGHGAYPHQAVDPILVASSVVSSLQSIVSRSIDPVEPCVVTVGMFNAGTAFNIIPSHAKVRGTARALAPVVRRKLEQRIRELAEGVAGAFGASVEISYKHGNPALLNDERTAALLTEAARCVVGNEGVFNAPPMMGGEDFAFYCERIPSAFALVGGRNPAINAIYPHHHPMFAIDERALGIGARMFMHAVRMWAEGAWTSTKVA